MHVRSVAFAAQAAIPAQYTCSGADVSPPLTWDDPPAGTKSFALICDDPDAPFGTWVHWVLYNLHASTRQLPENVSKQETLPDGTRQGINDFRRVGYGGPCPPPGSVHHYRFTLDALDVVLNLAPRATKAQLEAAMHGHILGQAALVGIYRR